MTTEIAFKEGDVYRFSYSEAERAKAARGWAGSLNHCFDGQVVVRNGKLCDTYWTFGKSGDSRVVSPDKGELTFVCNLNDVVEIRESETRHYDEADVFNLSYQHGCYRKFAIRKGAQPSATRMLEEVRIKENAVRQEMESTIRHNATTLVQLGEMRYRLESGDLSKTPWW